MRVILIYDASIYEYEQDIIVKEFESESEMIGFINNKNIGNNIISAWSVLSEIRIVPKEKVIEWEVIKN